MLFSDCERRAFCGRVKLPTQAEEHFEVPNKSLLLLPQQTSIAVSFKKSNAKHRTISDDKFDQTIFAQMTPVESRVNFDLAAQESPECVLRNLSFQFEPAKRHSPLILPRILNFNLGFTAVGLN